MNTIDYLQLFLACLSIAFPIVQYFNKRFTRKKKVVWRSFLISLILTIALSGIVFTVNFLCTDERPRINNETLETIEDANKKENDSLIDNINVNKLNQEKLIWGKVEKLDCTELKISVIQIKVGSAIYSDTLDSEGKFIIKIPSEAIGKKGTLIVSQNGRVILKENLSVYPISGLILNE